jgi:hypothetical protein
MASKRVDPPLRRPPLRLPKVERGNLRKIEQFTKRAAKAAPIEEAISDAPVYTEEGTPTTLSLPVRDMSRVSYSREMAAASCRVIFRKYIKTLPLEELKFALARNDSTKAVSFLASLTDPDNAGLDIADIAVYHGINLGDLMQIWRNDRLALAMSNLFDSLPPLTADAAEDARSVQVCCPRCDGAESVQVETPKGSKWIECPNCRGKGTVRKVGDQKARDHILRATGVIKPDTGMTVNIGSTSHNVESVLDELERLGEAPSIPVAFEKE